MTERFDRAERGRSSQPGFTLIEVIVALAVLLIIAAVAAPSLVAHADQVRVNTAATQLAGVRDALYKPGSTTAFLQTVGSNAGRLSELAIEIVKNDATYATGSDNSCGGTFKQSDVNGWDASGPFVNYTISRASGMTTPIGIATDSLTRNPAAGGAGTLRINFLNAVSQSDAEMLDATVDASDGSGAGTVQWVLPATNGVVTMYYFVTINATC